MYRTDLEDFPFWDKRNVWYQVIDWKNRKTLCCTWEDIKSLSQKSIDEKDYVIYGVWTGKWRTDLFLIPFSFVRGHRV